ncbi:thymidine kinase [Henriciella mobilis]|uniref:thymidine kinase n=1 Tax=Henriciella mobilis TaxID=2305467 RepID=UPI000E66EFC6|nr:thymidine kinase [Henriciella mobilis]RIJ14499.1 thymidine kinase [Henriciella mobilis]RIJ19673.1 thymidine kinase [Henriciella mobilis]
MAKLYFIYSAMNAGKSTILLQSAYNYRERGMQVMLWTSGHYRDGETDTAEITSRIGLNAEARLYRPDIDLFEAIAARKNQGPLDAVFVDEAQFLEAEQVWQLARVADRLHVPVMCYGLRTDFQGKLFPGSAELLAISDQLREVRTICHCGSKATMTARVDAEGRAITEGRQVEVEKSHYVSLCRQHWEEATHIHPE